MDMTQTPLDPATLYQKMIETRRALPPSPIEQERQAALADYQNTLRTEQLPSDPGEAFVQGSVQGLGQPFNPWAPLQHGIQAFQAAKEAQRQELYKRAIEASKVGYTDVADRAKLESLEERALLPRSGLTGANGKIQVVKDAQGNVILFNNSTGQKEVIPSVQAKLWEATYSKALQVGFEQRDPDAHENAVAYANAAIGQAPKGNVPLAAAQPPTTPVRDQPGQPTVTPGQPAPNGDVSVRSDLLPPEVAAEVERLISRLAVSQQSQNPNHAALHKATIERLQTIQQQYGAAPPVTSPVAPPARPRINYLDQRTEKSNQAYGTAEGKDLADERKAMGQLHASASEMFNDVSTLKSLYTNFDLPEGKYADLLQGVKSGLKSFGIDTGKATDAGALVESLANEMALRLRTQGQQNLMPGAMSNFDAQLLLSMAPTLSRTQAGRLALIETMKSMAESNKRLAEEATKFAGQNNDRLTPAWQARKERIVREEMARRALLRQRLMKQIQSGELQ